MANVQRIIDDFLKGAGRAGVGVQAQVLGTEQKLADAWGPVGDALGVAGPLAGAGIYGAQHADSGHRGRGALGAMGGGTLGYLGGTALGGLIGAPTIGGVLGAGLGTGMGGYLGGSAPEPSMLDRVRGKLGAAHAAGVEAAKLAFLGPLLSAGASALAPSLARGALGKVAPKALGAIAKPMAGAMFDTGVSMGAQKALQ
jgi:hypothetical protein